MDKLRYISVHNYEYILGSQCTSYLQQHKLVLTCVAWGADRKDAVLHIGPSSFLVAARGQEAVCEVGGRPAFSAGVA